MARNNRRRVTQEDVDNDYKSVSAMAERLGFSKNKEDHSRYVDEHMTRLGHKRRTSYIPNDDDEEGDGKSEKEDPFFG